MNQIWKKNPATHRSMEDGGRGRQNRIFRENFLKEFLDGFAWNLQNLADMSSLV